MLLEWGHIADAAINYQDSIEAYSKAELPKRVFAPADLAINDAMALLSKMVVPFSSSRNGKFP